MNSPLVILQISDLHILATAEKTLSDVNTDHTFQQLLKQAYAKHGKIDLTLVTGDLAQDPCQSSYQRTYKALEKYNTRTICLPGNHDELALMQQFIYGKQVDCSKHIQLKNWQIISLNSKKEGSEGGYLSSNELDYLGKTLQSKPDLNTLIAVHHHPTPIDSSWMDGMMIENNEDLFEVLKNHPQVKAIVCGHIHQVFNTLKENILVFGVPSTCFQFAPNATQFTLDDKDPGYRILKLYSDGMIESNVYRCSLQYD